ncbi:MAG: sulfotransferase [Phycisphaerales bacterium]|nr:sulfotransferase [Phycisphaerales bacterium]
MSISSHNPHESPSFVLVGPLRGGTTLLNLMLNSHPQIASVGEFEESVSILDDTGWPDLDYYRSWLAQHRVASSRNYTAQPNAATYTDLVSQMWSQLATKHSKPVIGCTIHSRFDRVRDIWPNTKFIHIIRDPRDVANSCVGMGWIGHPAKGSIFWTRIVRRWKNIVEHFSAEDYVQIRYEDLLANPQIELGRCCALLGLEYHPDMLNFHQSTTYAPLDPTLAEQWRHKMNPRTAEIIDVACRQWMESYGYESSTPDPIPPRLLELFKINVHNRIGRFRYRVNRYGVVLTVKWALVKRFSIDNVLRISVNRKINEIDTTHLR